VLLDELPGRRRRRAGEFAETYATRQRSLEPPPTIEECVAMIASWKMIFIRVAFLVREKELYTEATRGTQGTSKKPKS